MPPVKLQPNVPVVITDTDVLEVAPGLSPGDHRIQLVVTDNQGNSSKPMTAIVTVAQG